MTKQSFKYVFVRIFPDFWQSVQVFSNDTYIQFVIVSLAEVVPAIKARQIMSGKV